MECEPGIQEELTGTPERAGICFVVTVRRTAAACRLRGRSNKDVPIVDLELIAGPQIVGDFQTGPQVRDKGERPLIIPGVAVLTPNEFLPIVTDRDSGRLGRPTEDRQ